MAHKKKKFDAVEMSRRLRTQVSRQFADMTPAEMVAFFKGNYSGRLTPFCQKSQRESACPRRRDNVFARLQSFKNNH